MFFISIKSRSINLLLAVCSALTCSGQVIEAGRYEQVLEQRDDAEYPKVASLAKEGILIYRRIKGKTTDQLELVKTDTSFTENWRGTISIEKNLVVSKVVAQKDRVFMLLRASVYGNFDFVVIALSARTGEYKRYLVKNLIPFGPTDFNISTNAILIGGYFNLRPVVLHFSFVNERARLLPGFFNDIGEISEMKTLDNGLIDIIVSNRNLQRKKVLWVRSYSADGDLLNTTVLEGETDKYLLLAKSFRKPDNTLLVAGVFGVRNAEYSRGYFTSEIKPDGTFTMKYYNFIDQENFFKFMRPKRELRVKERIKKRKMKGRKIRLSYRFLVHELVPYQNQYLLLSESFYPRYIYTNPYSSFGGGRYYSSVRNDRIFDGYRYTHASILGLDGAGEVKWDNAFEINDVKTFTYDQFVKLAPKGDHLGLLYLFDNNLHTKIINNSQVLEGKSTKKLSSKFDTDFVRERDTESSALEYWYDPYFIAYGIQYIRDHGRGREGTDRMVLFINKLKYQ